MKHIKIVFAGIALIIILDFSVRHIEKIRSKFFEWEFTIPLAIIALAIFIPGAGIGSFIWSIRKNFRRIPLNKIKEIKPAKYQQKNQYY